MEEPGITPRPQFSDPDVRALEARHEHDVRELELAAELIAAEFLLIAVLLRGVAPHR